MQKTPEQWLEETALTKKKVLAVLKGWRKVIYWSAIHAFFRDAPPIDVHIVTQEPK